MQGAWAGRYTRRGRREGARARVCGVWGRRALLVLVVGCGSRRVGEEIWNRGMRVYFYHKLGGGGGGM